MRVYKDSATAVSDLTYEVFYSLFDDFSSLRSEETSIRANNLHTSSRYVSCNCGDKREIVEVYLTNPLNGNGDKFIVREALICPVCYQNGIRNFFGMSK